MLLLGFSAGLPLLLVFSTLTARLSDLGVETATIGFFSWLGITYSIKVIWAPVVDWLQIPLLTRLLGQRRSWMLLAQGGIALGLWQMAITDPVENTTWLALSGLLVAFSSATQDVSIDAFRIEAAEARFQAAMSAMYVFGYRLALLVAGAGALYIAQFFSWSWAYLAMAALMGIGAFAVLVAREPQGQRHERVHETAEAMAAEAARQPHMPEWAGKLWGWLKVSVVAPFVDFFTRYGKYALPVLVLVAVFRICDLSMGVMANPFYLDYMGFSKVDVANVTKVFGFMMTILGAGLGGVLVARFGIRPILLVGAISTALTNLLFVMIAQFPDSLMTTAWTFNLMGWVVHAPFDLMALGMVVGADNLSGGLATVAFIAWLSSMTNVDFTATQYALFSSLMTLPGKFIGGFSGLVVESAGYPAFFVVSAFLGLPAILLAYWVCRRGNDLDAMTQQSTEPLDPSEHQGSQP
ncbi:MFS transporter [Marinobacteraceae bacterium S3BR75-40.1]